MTMQGDPPASILASPQRQLPVAIVAEFFGGAALRQFAETMLPALLVGFAAGGRLTLVLVPVAVVVFLGGVVLRWWRTRFWVERGELVLERGVLRRTRLQVPLDRIQQISTEQGLIQQLFDVRKVSIDSAGSVDVEFSLTAVSNAVVAELRQLIVGADTARPVDPEAIAEPRWGDTLVHMGTRDLIVVGLVRPGGQIVSAVVALLGLGLGQAVDSFVESRITGTLAAATFAVVGVGLGALMLVGGAVLRDHDLTVWRSERGLRLTAGLVTKREQFARIERVQLVRRRANPLERLLGRTTVLLAQASALAGNSSSTAPTTQNFLVPSAPNATLDGLTGLFIGRTLPAPTRMISARSRWRWGLYGAVWPSLVVGAGGAVVLAANGPMSLGWPLLVVAALVLVGGLATSRLAHRRWRWDIDGSALRTRHGVLIDRHTDVELRKIQSVEVRRSWWQRRNGLATITFRTAGGSVAIPHLDGETAASMRDGVLAIVERTKGPWM